MTNVALERAKLNQKNQSDSFSNLGKLMESRWNMQKGAPDPRSDIGDMLGRSAQEVTGGQPARGWRALLAGMLEGAGTGLKAQVSKEKKEIATKMGNVFEYLESNQMAMARKNQEIENNIQQQKDIMPYANTAAQIAFAGGSYESKNKSMEGLFNQIQLNQPNFLPPGSQYISLVPNSTLVNYRDKEGNAQIKDFSSFVDPGVLKDATRSEQDRLLDQAAAHEEREMAMRERGLAIQGQNASSYQKQVESTTNPESQMLLNLAKAEGKNVSDILNKAYEHNNKLEDAYYSLKDAKETLLKDKLITGDNIGSTIQRLTGKMFNTEGMTQTQLYDNSVRALYEHLNSSSFGNANQKEFEFMIAPLPDSKKTPQALGTMLDRVEDKINRKIKANNKIIDMGNQLSPFLQREKPDWNAPLPSTSPPSAPSSTQPNQGLSAQATPPSASGMTPMRFPDNSIRDVPNNEVDDVIRAGGVIQ